jgi:type II secretory pathway pseudopilin PulG
MRGDKDNMFMELAGQAAPSESNARRSWLDDRGYIMVVLLIAMAVTAVWMGAALPAWRQQATREKELELMFRGQQYARAVALYYRKNNNVLPVDIDTLVAQKYLRKKWKDPISNTDFVLIGGGTPVVQGGPVGGPQGGPPVNLAGRGGPPTGATSQAGGVMGVFSKSTATSIIVYKNQQEYDLWKFLYTDALMLMGVGQGPMGGSPTGPGGRRQGPPVDTGSGAMGPGGRGGNPSGGPIRGGGPPNGPGRGGGGPFPGPGRGGRGGGGE